MAMYSIIKGYGILGENDKIKELYKQFRSMYRKLVFKNTSMKFKYKCGIFALNKQIFIKLKNVTTARSSFEIIDKTIMVLSTLFFGV